MPTTPSNASGGLVVTGTPTSGQVPTSDGAGGVAWASPTTAVIAVAPSFPLVSDFANAAWWEADPVSGLWTLAPQGDGTLTDADDKASCIGGATWRNSSNLSAADVNTTVASALYVAGSTSGNYIFDPGATDTAPHRAVTYPFPRGGSLVHMLRVRTDDATTSSGDKSCGILVTNASSALNGFYALALRSGSSNLIYAAGTGFTGGSAVNAAINTADFVTGIWLAVVINPDGSIAIYYLVSASTVPPRLEEMTLLTRKTSVFTPSSVGNLYVGPLVQRFGSPSGTNKWEFRGVTETVPPIDETAGSIIRVGLSGRQSTRSSTAIPVIAANIGASATYSDAEIIARLARAVSGNAAIRAYIQRGASYAAPADGAGGWVTRSSGTFAGLATVGTGAKLSVWLDAASTGGVLTARFSPAAFGALGIA